LATLRTFYETQPWVISRTLDSLKTFNETQPLVISPDAAVSAVKSSVGYFNPQTMHFSKYKVGRFHYANTVRLMIQNEEISQNT
jgi:hypothetical protein